jgi:hypothetical protein
MHEVAAEHTPQRRFTMYPNFDFIRRFAKDASQLARLVAFNVELDVDITEAEIVEELEVRGYGVYAGR